MPTASLSKKDREKLLATLKTRFEKNMSRHKGLEWTKIQAKLEANEQKLWPLQEMEKQVANRMLLAMTRNRANTFLSIVPRRVRRAAEASAMTVKR
jgi:hypothetical protein